MIFGQSQRFVDVFTCACQKCNSTGWDNDSQNICDDESENNPRERINKQRVNCADEVGANWKIYILKTISSCKIYIFWLSGLYHFQCQFVYLLPSFHGRDLDLNLRPLAKDRICTCTLDRLVISSSPWSIHLHILNPSSLGHCINTLSFTAINVRTKKETVLVKKGFRL